MERWVKIKIAPSHQKQARGKFFLTLSISCKIAWNNVSELLVLLFYNEN